MANPTKKILADSLKEIMKTKSLSRISIEDITGKCGLKRQTFYYHFADKYKLVNWIFDREVLDNVEHYLKYESWDKGLEMVYHIVEDNSPFYLNALQDNFSYFYMHLMQTQRSITYSLIEDLLEGRTIEKNDSDFLADFYANALVGTFISWVNSGMREPGSKVIDRLRKIIRGTLKNSMASYIK